MKTALLTLLAMSCAIAAHSSLVLNTNVIKIEPIDNGLVWPLPDSSDLVSIFVHAVHCKHMVKLGRNVTEMNKMHVQHCKRVVQSVEEVVRTAEIEVSQSVCNVLFGVNPEYYRMRARLGDYTYYAGDVLDKVNTGVVLSDGMPAIAKLAGYNYGVLLMKEYYNDPKNPLTDKEREYLDSWFKPVAMQQSAIAYICQEQFGIEVYEIEDEPGVFEVHGSKS